MSDFVIENGVLKKYQGPGGDVVIPDGVTSIGWMAFSGCRSLTSVVIPVGVTLINNSAFRECISLASVILPEGVAIIGEQAFYGCKGLMSVTLPESVTSIGDVAFLGCAGLQDEQGLVIVRGVLYDCVKKAVVSVAIPGGVTEIGELAFYNCEDLKSVTIPDGVTTIGGSAFAGCSSLTAVAIPDSVTSIGDSAFRECSSLTSVAISAGVTSIGDYAFARCTSLESMPLPDSVTSIGGWAFQGCSNLMGVTFRGGGVHVGYEMFLGCDKLCRMEMPIGQLSEMDGAFAEEKAVALTLHLEDGSEVHVDGRFRKHGYLIPMGKENLAVYDRLVAVGKCEGFRMTADERVRAALRRLTDREEPVSSELRPLFSELLAGKVQKAVKLAEEEQNAAYIRALVDVGAVTDANRKKVQKLLKASAVPEIKSLADDFDALAAAQPASAKESSLAGEYADRLEQLKATPLLVQYGVTSIPSVMLKDGSGAAPEEYLRLILAEYITLYKNGGGYAVPLADEAAAKLERTSLLSALWQLHDMQTGGNSQMMASLPLLRYGGSADVDKLCRQWKKDGQGVRFLNKALMFSGTRAAVLYMENAGRLWEYAQSRDTDVDTLRDTVLADFGFDGDGKKRYNLGEKTVAASLGRDLEITLYDEAAGKAVKSLPKRGADPEKYAAANADLSDLRKNVKKVAKARSDRLFGNFLSGNTYEADKWRKAYLGNPVLRRVAELLVWSQNKATFTLGPAGPVQSDGMAYTITDAPIAVAHPMEMAPVEVAAWQRYFVANGLKQPFEQVWEPVTDPKTIRPERYKGQEVSVIRFMHREKHGIRFYDENFHNNIGFSLDGCSLEYERTNWHRHEIGQDETFTLGAFSFRTYTRQVNHIVALLDRWTVAGRILKDDVTVREQLDGFTAAQIMEYIRLASENSCPSCAAMLLEYKRAHYPDFDPMAEFTLE